MAEILMKIDESIFSNISDAIRSKTGKTDKIYPSDMASEINSITTNNGIDTSDATATDNDTVKGKTFYANGVKITGNLNEVTSGNSVMFEDSTPSVSSSNLRLNAQFSIDNVMRTDSWIIIDSPLSNFGNAKTEDVLSGVTFTSENGLKLTGTATFSSSGDTSTSGLTVKNGTTTSNIIETGLSSLKYVVIYKNTSSISATGLVEAICNIDEGTNNYTYCSQYSSYYKGYAVGSTVSFSVTNGTFTWNGSNTVALTSGDTYNWFAVGNE